MIVPIFCFGDEITLQWDYENSTDIDGFRIYGGPMGQDDNGVWVPQYSETPIAAEISPEIREYVVVENGWEGQKKKWCFMARAYRGDTESTDSNYACTFIDNTQIAQPTNIVGEYKRDPKQIILSWDQSADLDRTKFWIVYYKLPDSDEYIQLGEVANTGSTELSMSAAFDGVADGEVADISLVVVAFKTYEIHSEDSSAVVVTVDNRGEVTPPANLRFKLRINIE